jgi:hypothetical protein
MARAHNKVTGKLYKNREFAGLIYGARDKTLPPMFSLYQTTPLSKDM